MEAIILFRNCVSRASWHAYKGSPKVIMFRDAFKGRHCLLMEDKNMPVLFCTMRSQDNGPQFDGLNLTLCQQ